jgi:hypothetical protein
VGQTLRFIRSPVGTIIGDGQNHMACVIIDEVARIIVDSASAEVVVGKAYNLAGNPITQVDHMNYHATAAGLKSVKRRISKNLARMNCSFPEGVLLDCRLQKSTILHTDGD